MALIKTVPIEEEFKKNPELKEADLQSLKDWCSKQPHLPPISDYDLILFLHSNYYHVEPTKATIDAYYTIRTHVPEFFANRDPIGCKELRAAMHLAYMFPLEMKTKEGYTMILCRLVDTDPSHYVYNDSMKAYTMVIDISLHTQGTSEGYILMLDMSGISIAHTTRLSPMGIKKYLTYLQDAMPIRLKGLHFINAVPAIDIILAMMKPFMKKELMDVLHVHTKMDTLAKFLPIEALTSDQGGKGGDPKALHEKSIKTLEDHQAWFKEEEATARVNESLRVGKAKNATDLFGVEGSFKKLEID